MQASFQISQIKYSSERKNLQAIWNTNCFNLEQIALILLSDVCCFIRVLHRTHLGHTSGCIFVFFICGYSWNNIAYNKNPYCTSGMFLEHTKFHEIEEGRKRKNLLTLCKSIVHWGKLNRFWIYPLLIFAAGMAWMSVAKLYETKMRLILVFMIQGLLFRKQNVKNWSWLWY